MIVMASTSAYTVGIEEAENEREIFKVGFRNSRVCFDTTILCNNGLFAE